MDSPDPYDPARPVNPGRGWVLVGLTAVGVGLVLAGGSAVQQAFARECRALPREDLSLAEMGQLRRLVDTYKSHPDLPMVLTARQASFLLREEFELQVWISAEAGVATLEARLPEDGWCWNVSFTGELSVEDAVATIRPDRMAIGDLSLSWLVAGAAWEVFPAQLAPPRAGELLSHLRRVRVVGDSFEVSVDDPAWLR